MCTSSNQDNLGTKKIMIYIHLKGDVYADSFISVCVQERVHITVHSSLHIMIN